MNTILILMTKKKKKMNHLLRTPKRKWILEK